MENTHIDPTSEINEMSALQRTRMSDLTTDSMKRRDAMKRQSMVAAAKADWNRTDLPIQPPNFGVSMTDGWNYC